MPTIGIAAVTTPGAIDCLNKINQSLHLYIKPHDHPAIILHQPNFAPTQEAQNQNRWDIVEDRLVDSIQILTKAGADFVIIPANTAHKVIEGIKQRSTIPVLNMLDIVADKCQQYHFKKIGILGTRWTMAEHLYQKPLNKRSIEELIPSTEDQIIIQHAIFTELIPTGKTKTETLISLLHIVEKLKNNGCDGIALACTELPLILNQENCGTRIIDTTTILAEAVVSKLLSS